MSSLTDACEWRQGTYLISTDRTRLDLELIHNFLKRSYWASGIPAEVVERSVENSLVFGLYREGEQVGFARVVTDCATFAYLADLFVMESHRGRPHRLITALGCRVVLRRLSRRHSRQRSEGGSLLLCAQDAHSVAGLEPQARPWVRDHLLAPHDGQD